MNTDGMAQALAGLGAGLQGRGVAFNQQLLAERKEKSRVDEEARQQRFKAWVGDVAKMEGMLANGNVAGIAALAENRMSLMQQLGVEDMEDTDIIYNLSKMASEGNQEALTRLQEDIGGRVSWLEKTGHLKAPVTDKPLGMNDGQVIVPDGRGGYMAQPIAGYEQSPEDRRAVDLRERDLKLERDKFDFNKNKLSAGAEKALLEAQDAYNMNLGQAAQGRQIAEYFEGLPENVGGVSVTFSEGMKNFFGNQDDYSEWRREFNQIRISQAMQNLPPGPASDVDVANAMKGVPKENAPPSQIASFARGVARIGALNAAYNMFKSDYISNKGNPRNLISEIRKTHTVTGKDGKTKKVSELEIYEAAVNRGISPDEVRAALGIE